jgi:hypothetical protein
MMLDENSPLARALYPVIASLAGAVTALSFRPYKDMSPAQIAFAVFVGFSFAYFVGPWVIGVVLGKSNDIRLQGGVFYLLASGSNALIPMAVKWISRVFGSQTGEGAK